LGGESKGEKREEEANFDSRRKIKTFLINEMTQKLYNKKLFHVN
jgi:hypothetical protein